MKKIASILLAAILILSAAITGYGATFTDVKQSHWSYEAINAMSDMAIITGYPDGSFKPNNTVTYGEFIKMALIAATGQDVGNASIGNWAANYYAKAIELNFFAEEEIDSALLNTGISRAYVALIISSILGDDPIDNYDAIQENITDINDQTPYRDAIIKAYANGILTGYKDRTFAPQKTLTRAEAVTVFQRLMDESKRVEQAKTSEDGFTWDGNKIIGYEGGQATSVTIPSRCTAIGDEAFADCYSLSAITIPSNVESIGRAPFIGCINLNMINVDLNNKHYASEDGVLFNKDKTTMIEYPSGKTRESYTIPSSVTSIDDKAFSYCSSLTTITIPSRVTSIGAGAFHYCDGLTTIIIPSNVTSIGDYAFADCDSLTTITISPKVTSIGSETFSNCSNLTTVTIPSSVTSIGDKAFSYCSSLGTITIPSSVTSIGYEAFSHCYTLTTITIPQGVTSIGAGAFDQCYCLTAITIPSSVTSISNYAFADCDSFTTITIPSSVTSIGDGAFLSCGNLAAVTIPSSVTNIGDHAFLDCGNLDAITIPSSVTSIGDEAFAGCDSLITITIPSSVTSIGDDAFYDCLSLKTVIVKGKTQAQANDIFQNAQLPSGCKIKIE